jgi:polysaccharide biosynthesis protein PslJ
MVNFKHLIANRERFALVAFGVLLLVAVAGVLGILSVSFTDYAILAACGVLLLGIAAIDLSLIPVLTVPATLIVVRVGGILTVSDLILAIGTLFALLMLRGRGARTLQPMLWAGVTYLAFLVPTLILNRYAANGVEWLHELFLVLGSLIVGFVIGREGKAPLALGLYVVICGGIGIVAAGVAVSSFASSGQFIPVYLGDLHKNTIGGMLAIAAVIAAARPAWLGWSRRWAYVAVACCGVGIFASQSRQGLIGAVVGIIIISLRPRIRDGRRGRLIWLVAVPIVIFVIVQVNDQLSSGNPFNSANQRLAWFAESVQIWQTSPVFGVGLRWWYTNRFGVNFQPPNAEFEMLTSGGIVGLAGFLILFAVAAWFLSKMNPVYGTVAFAVLATRFTQAQFDLYWVAGQASLLWIVAGISYGVMERDRAMGVVRPGAATSVVLPGYDARLVTPWTP